MKGDTVISNRALRPILWTLGAAAAFYIAISWPGWQREAGQAAGLSARIACSCRYVEGRPAGSCDGELAGMPWMTLVRHADDPQARRVTASVPLMARRSARFRDGFGCLPEK